MTILEQAGLDMLTEFLDTAEKRGICYKGIDMPPALQIMIYDIVKQYVADYEYEREQYN